jgi:hypothetical protein
MAKDKGSLLWRLYGTLQCITQGLGKKQVKPQMLLNCLLLTFYSVVRTTARTVNIPKPHNHKPLCMTLSQIYVDKLEVFDYTG